MNRVISLLMMATGLFLAGGEAASGQGTVPGGINYQAVARDNNGKEIVNTDIEVMFTISSGAPPTGTVVYQEVYTDVTTSKYGVFSLVIGKGEPLSGTFADIDWSSFNHYLKVSVKFENNFMDMGTMQFMAVPYALYAGKSLEPGPKGDKGETGAKGDPGDPASDDQTLLYNRIEKILTIDNGNSVRLDSIIAFRAKNETSDPSSTYTETTMTYDSPDMSIGGGFDPSTGIFTTPAGGIYTFNVSYFADGTGGSREVSIFKGGALFEKIAIEIGQFSTVPVKSVTMWLNAGEKVEVKIFTGAASQTGTGSFAGYKVN
jgi:hypothetical protein